MQGSCLLVLLSSVLYLLTAEAYELPVGSIATRLPYTPRIGSGTLLRATYRPSLLHVYRWGTAGQQRLQWSLSGQVPPVMLARHISVSTRMGNCYGLKTTPLSVRWCKDSVMSSR